MKKFLNIAAIILAALVILGLFQGIPAFLRVIWFVLFLILWLSRKFFQDTIIALLQNPNTTNTHPWLRPFLWIATKSKRDKEADKDVEFVPNEISLSAIRHAISSLIYVVFVGLPLLLRWIIESIAGWFGTRFDEIGTIFADLTGAHGIGYIIFAIVMILVAIATIVGIIYFGIKWYKYPLVDGGRKKYMWIIVGIIVVSHVISYIYFGYTGGQIVADIISHIVRYGILFFIYVKFLRPWLSSRFLWLP